MQNWVFFPNHAENKKLSEQESLDMLLFMLSHDQRFMITKDEWHTLMPESKPPVRGPSLGFCCGNPSGGKSAILRDLQKGLPPVSIRKYKSDFLVQQKAWSNDFACTIKNNWQLPGIFTLFTGPAVNAKSITVSGTLILEQSFFVWGSKGTRFSKYRLPKKEFDKIITLDLQKR